MGVEREEEDEEEEQGGGGGVGTRGSAGEVKTNTRLEEKRWNRKGN